MASLLSSAAAFTPRREFHKTHNTPHHFALLAFNGADILRLSHFPENVISALRKLFEEQHMFRGFRDDQELGVSEFIMADKPWTSGKNSRTERLVTLIFCTILSHQFKLVTTLAYGRLAQDSCSLVFSKTLPKTAPIPPSNGSSAFTHPGAIQLQNVPPTPTPGSSSDTPSEPRTTFALSLTSKCLRVVCPPKSCTPGILASVRSAWPRGVVSESRPEDDVYEFNLKGYSLFSSSTFERDALAHIFTLLRALDAQSLQLITNLNLTQGIAKSRTKDLWIFEAPADPPSPDPTLSPAPSEKRASLAPNASAPRTGSIMSGPGIAGLGAGYTQYLMDSEGARHIRAATEPSEGPLNTTMIVSPGLETVSPMSMKMPQPHPDGQASGSDVPPNYMQGPAYPQPVNFGDEKRGQMSAAGVAGAAAIAGAELQKTDQERFQQHLSTSPTSPSDDAALLHGDAFRASNYSYTTDGRLDTGRSTTNMNDDDEGMEDGQMTPRMGNTVARMGDLVGSSQSIDDHHLGVERPQDPRRKSEKALMGFMLPEPEHVPPVPAVPTLIPERRPSGWDRIESTSTMYPPGGFPRTPPALMTPTGSVEGAGDLLPQKPWPQSQQQRKSTPPQAISAPVAALVGSGAIPLAEMGLLGSETHRRTTSQTTDRSAGTTRSGRRPKSPSAGSSKGWVLVNVEPRGTVKSSNSYSEPHHVRNQSDLSMSPSVRNVRKNDPGDDAGATAPIIPREPSGVPRVKMALHAQQQQDDSDTGHDQSAPIPRRRASLRKKPPPPPKDNPIAPNGDAMAKKGFLGMFGTKRKNRVAAVAAANGDGTDGTTDEDTDGAGNPSSPVEKTEMTWRGRRQKSK
ncbi:hypothetical protein FRB98_001344 [Tulasnella sp. 332]|nr:hypothetical protein FRB98_001344 [Tulasnella sp. 332]